MLCNTAGGMLRDEIPLFIVTTFRVTHPSEDLQSTLLLMPSELDPEGRLAEAGFKTGNGVIQKNIGRMPEEHRRQQRSAGDEG